MTSKLSESTPGWVANIIHHPSPNFRTGMSVPRGVNGVLFHTMVGNLPGTDAEFENKAAQLSAHFGIGQDGTCIQWVNIRGAEAWAEAGGNPNWYSCEMADNGNPNNPYTEAQLNRAAQLAEFLSRPSVGNFPLQVTDSVTGEGLGTHSMGGMAWGGHSCPDAPPNHIRSNQRREIIRRAILLRTGPLEIRHVAEGHASLDWNAEHLGTTTAHLMHVTRHSHAINDVQLAAFNAYVKQGTDTVMPAGLVFFATP